MPFIPPRPSRAKTELLETHGFLQFADGSAPIAINYLDPITGQQASLSGALGINPAGAIVGLFVDSNGEHGFVGVSAGN